MTTSNSLGIIGLDEIFRDPYGVAERIVASHSIFGLVDIEVRYVDKKMLVLWLSLDPWAPMADLGYPNERVSVTILSNGRVLAVPFDANSRSWYHSKLNNIGRVDAFLELCLWADSDPRPLRWEWTDGLATYLTIVHRHLQAEEYYRRNQVWPAEDAPHGLGEFPIRTLALSRIVHESEN